VKKNGGGGDIFLTDVFVEIMHWPWPTLHMMTFNKLLNPM